MDYIGVLHPQLLAAIYDLTYAVICSIVYSINPYHETEGESDDWAGPDLLPTSPTKEPRDGGSASGIEVFVFAEILLPTNRYFLAFNNKFNSYTSRHTFLISKVFLFHSVPSDHKQRNTKKIYYD